MSKPEALQLADAYEATGLRGHIEAAAELRRLYAENVELKEQRDELLRARQVLGLERIQLQAQRDDLLEALKACDEAMDYMSEYDIPLTLPDQVKAAISKATGGAT